ncbi:VOC family protein [Flavitalea sp. BT771]|uniref:VOC family protein n=1 Tax=Flavitalea sp. BT771 TaxID=3063329 RepID=UPI0026E2BFA0|nr:VOC family protein [Flavitalea sp. BT771]MDO6430862.1 VOC family protein [Flavitalea sp. BT771]MDV6218998.1 VOC family protein [Flavitalea sp. BT771]
MKTFTIQTMSPQLPVADLDRAIRFYTEKLDFKLDFRYEDFYAGIVKDGCSVHLKLGESLQEKTTEDLDLVFSVNDVERIYGLLIDRAVDICQPLRDMPYGKEFYVADPDGNKLAFLNS